METIKRPDGADHACLAGGEGFRFRAPMAVCALLALTAVASCGPACNEACLANWETTYGVRP